MLAELAAANAAFAIIKTAAKTLVISPVWHTKYPNTQSPNLKLRSKPEQIKPLVKPIPI